jgi:hypothetical protein
MQNIRIYIALFIVIFIIIIIVAFTSNQMIKLQNKIANCRNFNLDIGNGFRKKCIICEAGYVLV